MNAKRATDTKAANKWEKMRNSYEYVVAYRRAKAESRCYNIDLIDLVLVSNFKGGFASIAEPCKNLDVKLMAYTGGIRAIATDFHGKKLRELDKPQLDRLCCYADKFLRLTLSEGTKIDGFGPSNASALLNIYFPDLLPILDRRVLFGAEIPSIETTTQRQVINIENHYQPLIKYVHSRLSGDDSLSIDCLDRELFSKSLPITKKRLNPTNRAEVESAP